MKRLQATQEAYREQLIRERNSKMYSATNDIRLLLRPLNVIHEETVPFELIFAHLFDNGKVGSTDFLAQSRLALQTATVEDFDQTSSRCCIIYLS